MVPDFLDATLYFFKKKNQNQKKPKKKKGTEKILNTPFGWGGSATPQAKPSPSPASPCPLSLLIVPLNRSTHLCFPLSILIVPPNRSTHLCFPLSITLNMTLSYPRRNRPELGGSELDNIPKECGVET
jgi:hypothetical protein